MSDAASVAVVDPTKNLDKYAPCFAFIEAPLSLRFDVAVQRATTNVFKHEKHVFACLDRLKHLDNVQVSHLLH